MMHQCSTGELLAALVHHADKCHLLATSVLNFKGQLKLSGRSWLSYYVYTRRFPPLEANNVSLRHHDQQSIPGYEAPSVVLTWESFCRLWMLVIMWALS